MYLLYPWPLSGTKALAVKLCAAIGLLREEAPVRAENSHKEGQERAHQFPRLPDTGTWRMVSNENSTVSLRTLPIRHNSIEAIMQRCNEFCMLRLASSSLRRRST